MDQHLARIKNKTKRISLDLIFSTKLFRFFINPDPRIIVYHGVAPEGKNNFSIRHIDPELFEKHLIFLKKNTHVISLTDFYKGQFLPGRKNVVITFDDGYRNNLSYAYPLLKKYEIPATIFITGINQTQYKILWADLMDLAQHLAGGEIIILGKKFKKSKNQNNFAYYDENGLRLGAFLKELNFEERMNVLLEIAGVKEKLDANYLGDYWYLLIDTQIKALSESPFIEIGSHGYYHNNLGFIGSDLARKEMLNSKEYLERLTNKPIISIAYPDGSYTRETVEIADELGFKNQLAVNYLFPEDLADPRIQNRTGIYSYETLPMQYFNMIS